MEVNGRHVMLCGHEQGSLRDAGASRYVAVSLYYTGSQPRVIRGPVTGNVYQFSHLEPVQSVDPRDAVDLLADRQFRLAR
jgi:hypothetical protein